MSSVASSSSKRSRRLWQAADAVKPMKVDTSFLADAVASPTSVFDAPKTLAKDLEINDDSSANKKSDRMEMMERSLIVSEVASKLEEFVKKALKGKGSSRSRRAGVVTPPYGYSRSAVITSRDLITYDDEYDEEEDLSGLVTDGDDSLNSADASFSGFEEISKDFDVPPVPNAGQVQLIVDEIRKRASLNPFHGHMIAACADVAEFLMTTAPCENVSDCCRKILELFSLSERLSIDFYSYRAALHPDGSGFNLRQAHTVSLRQALEGGSSRLDALREFKIFAVNLIYRLLGKNGSFDIEQPFSHSEVENLLRTADAWSKSVGMVA